MKLIWTKSHFMPVDLISWGLEEPCGHFGVEFFNSCVYHSFAFGPECIGSPGFFKKRELIYSIDVQVSKEVEIQIFQRMIKKTDLKYYDYKYFFWLLQRGFLFKLFGQPLKAGKTQQNKNEFICHEIADELNPDIQLKYDREKAITPYRLFREIYDNNKLAVLDQNHFRLI